MKVAEIAEDIQALIGDSNNDGDYKPEEFEDGQDDSCWKKTSLRTFSGLPSSCAEGQEADLLACYDPTPKNHSCLGPTCTLKHCPRGFTDWGLSCSKPLPYHRKWKRRGWFGGYWGGCKKGYKKSGTWCKWKGKCPSGTYSKHGTCIKKTTTRAMYSK